MWDLPEISKGSNIQAIDTGKGRPTACALSLDGLLVAVGFGDGAVGVFSIKEKKEVWRKTDHAKEVTRLAFHPSGETFASASFDGKVLVWSRDGKKMQTFQSSLSGYNSVAFSPDRDILAAAGYRSTRRAGANGDLLAEGGVALFSLSGSPTRIIPADREEVLSASFVSDHELLTAGRENKSLIWDLATTPAQHELVTTSPRPISWAARSPNGEWTATATRSGTVLLKRGEFEKEIGGHDNTVVRATFSPDSAQIWTASSDGTLRITELQEYRELFTIKLPTSETDSVWDLDLISETNSGDALVAVPLTVNKVMIYRFPDIYSSQRINQASRK
jgi:WD40 repeat protein